MSTLIYLASRVDVTIGKYHFPANPRYRRYIISFLKFISSRMKYREIWDMPVYICRDGVADILLLIDKVRKGQTSGKKTYDSSTITWNSHLSIRNLFSDKNPSTTKSNESNSFQMSNLYLWIFLESCSSFSARKFWIFGNFLTTSFHQFFLS